MPEADIKEKGKIMGRQILLIGIGQSGCSVVERFSDKFNRNDTPVTVLAIDTDSRSMSALSSGEVFPMVDYKSLASVIDDIGYENAKKWFPCDWDADCTHFAKALDMSCGANLWRMKALLSFASFLKKEKEVKRLHNTLNLLIESYGDEDSVDLYVVASLAGGTGSALFMPFTMYVKEYILDHAGRVSSSTAMLVMPDIYSNIFSAEQRVKSYANMYAALKELNSLNISTRITDEINRGEKHPPIIFEPIIAEGSFSNILFDKVYLFERTPGINSLSAHLDLITNTLVSLCNDTSQAVCTINNTKKSSDAVYGSLALVRVKYPVDCIVKYITKEQLYTFASSEISMLHNRVMNELKRRRGEARAYGIRFNENTSEYCKIFLSVVDDIVSKNDFSPELLERSHNVFDDNIIKQDIIDDEFISQLFNYFETVLSCDASKAIEFILSQEEYEKNKKPKGKKLSNMAFKSSELLTQYYRNGFSFYIDKKHELVNKLLDDTQDTPVGLIVDCLLKKDGEFLHPVYALYRMSYIYNMLNDVCRNLSLDDDIEIDKLQLPYDCMTVDAVKGGKSKYSNCGENRFFDLSCGNLSPLVVDDYYQFCLDLGDVYRKVSRQLKLYGYSIVLKIMEETIDKYRSFIEAIDHFSDDIKADVKLACLQGSTDSSTEINVGVSEDEKRVIYNKYIKFYSKDSCFIDNLDALTGSLFFSLIRHKDLTKFREKAETILSSMEAYFEARCYSSDFYMTEIDKDIFTVVFGDIESNSLKLSRAFSGISVPLHICLPDEYDEFKMVSNNTVAIFPECLKENIAGVEESTSSDFIKNLIHAIGGNLIFSNKIKKNEFYVRREITNLKASFVEALNEISENNLGYRSYRKSMEMLSEQNTLMWNPHLVYSRSNSLLLRYINPNVQEEYEISAIKAIFYAFIKEILYVGTIDNGKEVYFICDGLTNSMITSNNVPILKNEFSKLVLWAHTHHKWLVSAAKKFDDMVNKELKHIPSRGLGMSGCAAIINAIKQSKTIIAVEEMLVDLVLVMQSDEMCYTSGYAEGLTRLGNRLFNQFCLQSYLETDEEFFVVYNNLLDDFMARLSEKKGLETAKTFFSWANSFGCFMKRSVLNGDSNYTFIQEQN